MNPKKQTPTTDRRHEALQQMTRLLLEQLRGARPDLVSTRVLPRRDLFDLFGTVSRDLPSVPGIGRITFDEFLTNLQGMGLAQRIPIEDVSPRSGTPMYLVEVGATADRDYDSNIPFELLMASEPKGVVSYFSALAIHNLVSQLPTHHHIAVPTPTPPRPSRPVLRKQSTPNQAPVRAWTPMGTRMFTLEGIPYFRTKRDPNLMPGVRESVVGGTLYLRGTTLEQTLLDTLHKPVLCGGVEVCMDAWETAHDRLDEEALADLLQRIGRSENARRLGALLEMIGHAPKKRLQGTIATMTSGPRSGTTDLFPGIKGRHLMPTWDVMVPWKP